MVTSQPGTVDMTVTCFSAHRRLEFKSDPRENNSHSCAQHTLHPFCVVSHSCRFEVFFEVLSDHGDEVNDDESIFETIQMMPPLPPDSWFKKTETLCGMFRKPCNEDHQEMKRIHSSIVGMGSTSSSTHCNKWILGHETHRRLNLM